MQTTISPSTDPRGAATGRLDMWRRLAAAGLTMALACGSPEVPTATDAARPPDAVTSSDMAAAEVADDSLAWQPDCPGGIGCPCSDPTVCDTPICLETTAGMRCSTWCGDGACSPGWRCEGSRGGRDATAFCVPEGGLLCRPCSNDTACQASGHAGARCVAYGGTGGFCGIACADDANCPTGYGCRTLAALVGGAEVKQCVRQPALGAPAGALGACPCSEYAVAMGLQTTCWVASGDGVAGKRCQGTRSCGPQGLGDCVALQGAAALCLDEQCLDPGTKAPLADGTACDDGRPCTAQDTCQAGVCQSGAQSCPCEPGFVECSSSGGITNACKGPLSCQASVTGAPTAFVCAANAALAVDCDDSLDDACIKNACGPLTGSCTLMPVERTTEICDIPTGSGGAPGCRREIKPANEPDAAAAACDDGIACSSGETCQGGACQGQDASKCQCLKDVDCLDDGDLCNGTLYCDKTDLATNTWTCKVNPATVKACDTSGDQGCVKTACVPTSGACVKSFAPPGTACSDGVACTSGDTCDQQGVCQSGAWTCCKHDADCVKEDDSDLCNGVLFCNKAKGACLLNPATVVTCPSVDDTTCRKTLCQPATGLCSPTAVNSSKPCDDGDNCTQGDVCAAGVCLGSADTCACAVDADCVAKDDGDLCNGTYYCNKVIGKCKPNPATIKVCPTVGDSACRRNQCQPTTGQCALTDLAAAVTCDADGSGCTQSDACDGKGACVAGTPVCPCLTDADCAAHEDGNVCNGTLYCDKSLAQPMCKLNPATSKTCPSVDDGACAKNLCQPATGACAMTPVPAGLACQDGVACTTGDGCDGKGNCQGGPASLCGCKATADCAAFDDGNLCNGAYACLGQLCQYDAKAATCADGDPCSQDSCEPKAGCQHKPIAGCLACAIDGDCDDGNACTADVCAAPACKHVAVAGLLCSDGDACTDADSCAEGACKAGTAANCEDGKVCTTDGCAAASGCVHQANALDCSDGDPCTVGDACTAGTCKGKLATESCNGTDDDCDGQTDEAGAAGCTTFFADGDKDGEPGTASACLCKPDAAFPAAKPANGAFDCHDGDAGIHHGAKEDCGPADRNCDGHPQIAGAAAPKDLAGCSLFAYDGDQDGHTTLQPATACLCGPDKASKFTGINLPTDDCLDADANVHPGQQAFFTKPNAAKKYDFNCDGKETKQATGLHDCPGTSKCAAATIQGWSKGIGTAPSCGGSAEFVLECTKVGTECAKGIVEWRTQACR